MGDVDKFEKWLEGRGYSRMTVYEYVRCIKKIEEEYGRVLDEEEVRSEYWSKSKSVRMKTLEAVRRYWDYRYGGDGKVMVKGGKVW